MGERGVSDGQRGGVKREEAMKGGGAGGGEGG